MDAHDRGDGDRFQTKGIEDANQGIAVDNIGSESLQDFNPNAKVRGQS